ncbi:MAG: Uma2 family endonuclease [Cyanobacteria bacterium J06634_6]
MVAVKSRVQADNWIAMSWDEYLGHLEEPEYKTARTYYYQGYGRFEMLPVGFGHGTNHVVVTYAINLFCALNTIPLKMADTTTLRKSGVDDSQPDLSIWTKDKARAIPEETGIVDLNQYPVPDLVVEVANTSLIDDMGVKRSLYEDLGVSEYWIIDVKKKIVLAFEMKNKGSQRIEMSRVLPGFRLSTMEEALRLSKETDQSQMGAWLLQQFQQ